MEIKEHFTDEEILKYCDLHPRIKSILEYRIDNKKEFKEYILTIESILNKINEDSKESLYLIENLLEKFEVN